MRLEEKKYMMNSRGFFRWNEPMSDSMPKRRKKSETKATRIIFPHQMNEPIDRSSSRIILIVPGSPMQEKSAADGWGAGLFSGLPVFGIPGQDLQGLVHLVGQMVAPAGDQGIIVKQGFRGDGEGRRGDGIVPQTCSRDGRIFGNDGTGTARVDEVDAVPDLFGILSRQTAEDINPDVFIPITCVLQG
jgi:hypothetical protein